MNKNLKINPIVTSDWLLAQNRRPDLVIIDIRNPQEYAAGHIPGSINLPFSEWITTRSGLTLELPDREQLIKVLGMAGITSESEVVVVNKADNPYPLADAARVADTIIYAGCPNAAVLSGGYTVWTKENKPVSKETLTYLSSKFQYAPDDKMFVSKSYVRDALGKSLILDTRTPDVYFGVTIEPDAQRPGHIPGAKNLPAPWIWNQDGTYRSQDELSRMSASLLRRPSDREIIIYCGVGGYTSAWWFVLTRVLDYSAVKFYDGSAQEWTADPELPVVVYQWE